VAQSTQLTASNGTLQANLAIVTRQLSIIQAAQAVTAAKAAIDTSDLQQQQIALKIQQDQLQLQITKNSTLTTQQTTLTLQLDAENRQTAQLNAQKTVMTDQNALSLLGQQQQQAVLKVQSDQLNLQLAQVQAQNLLTTGVTAMLNQLNAALTVMQAMAKVQIPAATAAVGAGVNAAVSSAGAFNAGRSATPTGGVTIPNVNLPGIWAGSLQSIAPTTTYGGPNGQSLITSGPYAGYLITQHVVVNVDGRMITELLLQNVSTHQTLEVNVPG
jgi:hypothetical protein